MAVRLLDLITTGILRWLTLLSRPKSMLISEVLTLRNEVTVWVPEIRLTSCDLLIFVDESSEPVQSG
jgi:hypothetical protein